MSEGTRGRGLSSIGLLREAPGGRKGLARGSALREDGASQPYPKEKDIWHTAKGTATMKRITELFSDMKAIDNVFLKGRWEVL